MQRATVWGPKQSGPGGILTPLLIWLLIIFTMKTITLKWVSVRVCVCIVNLINVSINQSVNQINQSHLFAKEDFTTLQRLFAPLSNHVHLLIL